MMNHCCSVCGKKYPCKVDNCSHPETYGFCSTECVRSAIDDKDQATEAIMDNPDVIFPLKKTILISEDTHSLLMQTKAKFKDKTLDQTISYLLTNKNNPATNNKNRSEESNKTETIKNKLEPISQDKIEKYFDKLLCGDIKKLLLNYLPNMLASKNDNTTDAAKDREKHDYRLVKFHNKCPEMFEDKITEITDFLSAHREVVKNNKLKFAELLAELRDMTNANWTDTARENYLNNKRYEKKIEIQEKVKNSEVVMDGTTQVMPSEFHSYIRKVTNNKNTKIVTIPYDIYSLLNIAETDYVIVAIKKAKDEEIKEYIFNQIQNKEIVDFLFGSLDKIAPASSEQVVENKHE